MADLTIKPFYIVYISAVYFSCCVMVTVGYPPTDDPLEKLYSMVLMVILSVSIFSIYLNSKSALAYSVGAIASIS